MTPKQKQTFDFIKDYISESGGVSPSFEEIKTHLGLKSKSGVHRLVWSLHEMGVIYVDANRARRIVMGTEFYDFVRSNALREVRAVATALIAGRISKANAGQKLLVLAGAA